jgi:hypothetical protein
VSKKLLICIVGTERYYNLAFYSMSNAMLLNLLRPSIGKRNFGINSSMNFVAKAD